jgi:hypothetical protein
MTIAEVDPFGLWPTRGSAIAGLGPGTPPTRSDHGFHTSYMALAPGRACFRVRVRGLAGRSGTLRLRVQVQRGTRPARLLRLATIVLDGMPRDVEAVLAFRARAGLTYALRGVVSDGAGARAVSVEVALDGLPDAEVYRAALRTARGRLFGTGATPWRRASRLEARGLVQSERATLARPVSQMCTAAQLDEPGYGEWLGALRFAPSRHRKQWEFVNILSVLRAQGLIGEGRRGLGFGAGVEPLPSLLAARGCRIVATDLPPDDRAGEGWASTNQHAAGPETLFQPDLIDRATFDRTWRSAPST